MIEKERKRERSLKGRPSSGLVRDSLDFVGEAYTFMARTTQVRAISGFHRLGDQARSTLWLCGAGPHKESFLGDVQLETSLVQPVCFAH